MIPKRIRLGVRLVEEGLITQEQLKISLDTQSRQGGKLGQILFRLGYLNEERFYDFFARELKLPLVDLKTFRLDPTVVRLLPESIARSHQAVVLKQDQNVVLLGMADPNDVVAADELAQILGVPCDHVLVSESQLSTLLDQSYQGMERIQEQATALDEEVGRNQFNLQGLAQSEQVVDAPVVRILQSLFEEAVRLNASDIHIEPDRDVLRIRKRIDGVLIEQVVREKRIAPALISKLKLMAGLEIAEKRLPQDGRFNISVKGASIDVRVSTLPIQEGESVVLRLLDQSAEHMNLDKVGMDSSLLSRFKNRIQRSHGLVLVTGPTGSGKTTTLYGALNLLNVPEKKIITVEDPVEYRLPRVNQVQVHTHIELTFSSILRTVLRQDPDIILVGEMRDLETAQIAIRAALTGHLVFSSLHTNSAIGATIRMMDIGLDGYAMASALQCIVAQRLVRRVCVVCRERIKPNKEHSVLLKRLLGDRADKVLLTVGRGCSSCNFSGYRGRVAVVEMLELTADLADALRRKNMADVVQCSMKQPGYVPLAQYAMEQVFQGVTALEEVLPLMHGPEEEWVFAGKMVNVEHPLD